MKKWFMAAAALAVVAATAPAWVIQAQAAPPKSPFCNLPKASNNSYAADASWADRYGCWGWHRSWRHHHHWWHHHRHHWWWHHRHH